MYRARTAVLPVVPELRSVRHTDGQTKYRNPRCACAPRVNYETIRDAGRTKEIRDCPGDSGTVGTYDYPIYSNAQSVGGANSILHKIVVY